MSDATTIIPSHLVAIFERPLLCIGEDRTQYDQLREMLMDDIKPTTVTEYLLAYDIVGAEWELLRLHGFKAGMINANMVAVFRKRYYGCNELPASFVKLFHSTNTGDGAARKELEDSLQGTQFNVNDLAATAYEENIAAQVQTAHMINAALKRRETAYAEIERRRHNGRKQSSIDNQKLIAAPVIDSESSPIAPTGPDGDAHVHAP
jgi:hypothetical protein